MKKCHFALAIMSLACLLQSCSTTDKSNTQTAENFIHRQNVYSLSKAPYTPKNPKEVSLYVNSMPHRAYRVIGVATISKYNLLGQQREEATIHQMMKNLAASIGGDAVIDLNNQMEPIKAHVIAFQKILI
ncbi:MAG: hypothetical protein JO149_05355 [Gammaproteobacteria bacterium]|nr:hypothetical protein [Gammaproteobacteria bacterium]